MVPLKDVFQSSERKIRIAATQQIYWDEAFVAFDDQQAELRQRTLICTRAELVERGFGRLLPRNEDEPHRYDYHDVSEAPKWPSLDGPFTRLGDVRGMLEADDDRLVVMTSGDEIALTFAGISEELPNGWKRDFVLHSVGWDKDADLNTIAGQGSLPLPFKVQTHYPAPPDQLEEYDRVWKLNESTLTRDRK